MIEDIMQIDGDPLGGSSDVHHFNIHFIGKTYSERKPFEIFNEKVASEIARILGLYSPEVVIGDIGNKPYFFSRFYRVSDDKGQTLPDASSIELKQFMDENSEYIHGMIIFDLFVANNDRRQANMKLDVNNNKLVLIDHGNSLLYYSRSKSHPDLPFGIERLNAVQEDMKIIFEDDRTSKFLDFLNNKKFVEKWCEKIKLIPDYFFKNIIKLLPDLPNISETEKNETTN